MSMLRSIYKGQRPSSNAYASSPLRRHTEEEEDAEETGEAEERNDSLGTLPSTSSSSTLGMAPPTLIPRTSKPNPRGKLKSDRSESEFSPISAADCFEDAFQVELEDQGSWRVYLTPPKPIEGGTRAPSARERGQPSTKVSIPNEKTVGNPTDPSLASLDLVGSPSDEEEEIEEQEGPPNPGTLFFFHHGAGFSGVSFALAAREVTRLTGGEVGVLAMDCRGHGRTTHPTSMALPLDMSLSRLTEDCVKILQALYPSPAQTPKLVLIGHSMGGSIVTSLCQSLQSLQPPIKVAGVAVLDVVEGTAMDALDGMKGIILSHPKGFESIEAGVKWHLDSGSIHNLESARRSVPSLLVPNVDFDSTSRDGRSEVVEEEAMEELREDDFSDVLKHPMQQDKAYYPFIWRTDLLATQEYWKSWFEGLSKRFLSVRTARLLLLAGTDRLDKELMVGQMQGKYQLTVFPDVGHCLQEDAPEKTAKLLVDFWRRNEVDTAKLGIGLKKVGDP